jgi:hypothetical protein
MKWKTIPGFKDYEVSDHGDVRRVTAKRGARVGRILRPATRALGHRHLVLRKNKLPYTRQVHALVLLAFKGPAPRGMVCAHFDGNGSNNNLRNLRWTTRSSNERDKVRHGKSNRGERHGLALLTSKTVKQIRVLSAAGVNSVEIKRRLALPVTTRCIRDVINNKRWSYKP